MAEELEILDTEFEQYPGGYGYLIGSGPAAKRVTRQTKDFLGEYQDVIDWAASSLAHKRPADLELKSTIVFIYKERQQPADSTLVSLVRAVKPHFSVAEVEVQIDWLKKNKLLGIERGSNPIKPSATKRQEL